MKIIGIDPGTAIVGWGVIEKSGHVIKACQYGIITTTSNSDQSLGLKNIFEKLNRIIKDHKPDVMSVEDLYFASNAKTAITVGQARGVILLSGALMNLPVVSYTPLVVKQTVCGHGQAGKYQVGKMVQTLLGLKDIPTPDDAADALAIALTHAYSYKFKNQLI